MNAKEELSMRISGEIVFSENCGKTIKKWRDLFGVSKTALANKLGVSTSVVCDYENGRRKSPGVNQIKKIIYALIETDEEQGSQFLRAYEKTFIGRDIKGDAILDIREFPSPVHVEDICDAVRGEIIVNQGHMNEEIYGYTAIDSLKAILELSSDGLLKVFGMTSKRALVFTKVSIGRSPFIAIRVSSIKPGLVVLHGVDTIDPLGIKIAEKEKIPVIVSGIEKVDDLIAGLRKIRV